MNRPPTTFVSFWHVELENLPTGTFSKRLLSTVEARAMVKSARAAGTLVCVTRDDLAAPYMADARERHEELCELLQEHADMQLQLDDFFGDTCVNTSAFATVTTQSRLLVVDCHYTFDARRAAMPEGLGKVGRTTKSTTPRLRVSLAPDSLQFHVIEQVDGAPLVASLHSVSALGRPGDLPDEA